ncbi:MAG: sulfatase family protein [Planctomycetota bacterium]
MKTRSVKLALAALLLAVVFPLHASEGATANPAIKERPNVIVILTDDQGWGDLTCYNPDSKIVTPNMDRLASEGLRMVNAYTPASVCSPTRYGLLTGRYPWRTWHKEGVLYHYDPSLIRPGRMTLGTLYQQLGYVTGAMGKWHLGLDWQPQPGDPGDWMAGQPVRYADKNKIAARIDFSKPISVGPNQVGFDEFFGTAHQGIDHVVIHNSRRVPDFRTTPENHDDLFVEHAIRFVTENRRRQPKRPFFLYLPLGSPHHGRSVPERWKGKSGDGVRGDRILWADENVGRIMKLLDEEQITDNTLVIFASDNGPSNNVRSPGGNSQHRPQGSYRGFKTDAWDGGFRVPLIVRWPGKIPAGKTANQVVCLTDLLATLADIAGVALPCWAGEDSYSMRAAWFGAKEPTRDHVVIQSYTGVLAIREGRWKLILGTEGSGGHQGVTPEWAPNQTGWDRIRAITVGQLYDLQDDPYEQTNVFNQHPEIVEKLRHRLEKIVLDGRSRAPN